MKVTTTTIGEAAEIMKAQFARASFKDLLHKVEEKEFTIEEAMVLTPDEHDSEDARMTGVLKVDGQYYKGISQGVLQSISLICSYEEESPLWRTMKFRFGKTSGKYGQYILTMV